MMLNIQYHVVFDGLFETISIDFQDPNEFLDNKFNGNIWRKCITNGAEIILLDDADPPSFRWISQ